MVEGARLESVYAGNRIWGSNPHLSAMNIQLFNGDHHCPKSLPKQSLR